MDEHFEWPARDALLAFKQRPDALEINRKLCRIEAVIAQQSPMAKLSFWRRLVAFPVGVWSVARTRRRLAFLQKEVGDLRTAVAAVVEDELFPIVQGLSTLIAFTEQVETVTRERLDRVQMSMNQALERVAIDGARALARENATLKGQVEDLEHRLRFERLTRQKALGDFDRHLALMDRKTTAPPLPGPPAASQEPASVQALLESFYGLIEERYRGTREEVKQRLTVYRNDLEAARDRTGLVGPVVDLGCGRGELLELLADAGFQAIGVDSNALQLAAARRHGGAVMQGDAYDYLRTLEADSVLAVTGIHIVEHIPFPDLVRLMQEVARVLKTGGVAIFETPNPRNLIVGATTFHLDPTHIRPLPAEVLQVLLETVGFAQIETRPLHPSDTLEYMVGTHNLDRHVATLLFGPQDYAVIGVMD